MLSDNEEPLVLGVGKPPAGRSKQAGKLGMAADASDDEDMFADICVDDLEEPQSDGAAPTASAGGDDHPGPAPVAAASPPANGDEERGEEAHDAGQGEAVQHAMPARPPLHPGKPTAAAAQQAAKLHAADPTGEGGQDSCSSGSEPCGGQGQEQEEEEEQQQQQPPQPAAVGDGARAVDGASLSHDPAPLEPEPTCSAAAGSPTLAAASAASPSHTSSPPNSSSSSPLNQQSPASNRGAAEPGPVAQLQDRLDALPQEPAEPAEPQVPPELDQVLLVQPAEQEMEAAPPPAAPRAVEQAAPARVPAATSAMAMQPAACPPAAMGGSRPVAQEVLKPAQPKQLPAGKAAPAVAKPALLAKPTSAAATPPVKPASAVATLPSKPAFTVAALPIPPASAPAVPAAPAKPVAKPGAIAAKFSMLAGGTPSASAAGSSLNLLLPKPGVGALKPASRLSTQAAGSNLHVSRASAGLPTSAAANPALAGAVSVQLAKQQQQQHAAPVLRQPAPASLPQAPAGPAAGTPISALPKHMQMALAAAHRASTPAPFTPCGDPSAAPLSAGPAAPPQQAQLSPRIPTPAALADDILAADFGPSAVLEGHEACMEESLALCVPIGDMVQEQMLALDQLNLEAEALRRQVNALRVDLTIYRSSLAFMDNPAHSFEAAKGRADKLWQSQASYQPPTFDMPPPFEMPSPCENPSPERSPAGQPEQYPAGSADTDFRAKAGKQVAAASPSASAEAAQGGAMLAGGESLIKPRALEAEMEAAFDAQPPTGPSPAGPPPAIAASAVPPTQETCMETADQPSANGVGAVPPTQETCMATAAAATADAPMELDGPAVSVVLSAGDDGVVLSLAA